ncbi:MAG: exodeoxyribonuclease VII small subunit [Alphaproteobacteria bacterium]|nr:exodeoxyribonuclease VII small subunit [Alphaproteobacteria bacterium]
MTTMTFEKAIQELETIVRKLEEGHMPLDESVKAYEKGIHLKKMCDEKLASAQLKIEEVMVANNKINTKPFEEDPK